MISLSISVVVLTFLLFATMLALGNVINRCKRYEALLQSITTNQLNIALTVQKLSKNQEDLANEVADAMPEFIRKGEVN